MAAQTVALREVENLEILSLMDNSIDFLSTVGRREAKTVHKWIRERRGEEWMRGHFTLPFAEHGFSMMIHTWVNGKKHCVLFDAGISKEGVVANAKRMGVDLSEVEAVALSHGHYDHSGGLQTTVKAIGKRELPVIVHEDMFKTRGAVGSNGVVRKMPHFPKEDLVKPAKYMKTKKPCLLANGTVLVSGEIPRVTDFEKGFPQHRALIDGEWQPDPLILDDRALVVNVKNKGLVVLSGCAHAGIVNTVYYARQITGAEKIYAIMGGFHLAGKEFETRINQTVEALKAINPAILVPSHCTGWRGMYAFAKTMPEAFVANSVGNLYCF